MTRKQEDKYGMISLILGIISVLFMILGFMGSPVGFFGFVLMILTFIFSGIQLKKNKNNLAIAGLVLAFIALAVFLFDAVYTASIARDIAYNNCLAQYDDSRIASLVCQK